MPVMEQRIVLVLAGIIYILGSNILLPGIDASNLPAILGSDDASFERVSLFALGAIPLYTAFAIGELCRVVFSSPTVRENRSRGVVTAKAVILPLIALGLVVLQGYGIANGLAAAGVVRTGAEGFTIGVITSFLGATALLIHLSDRIRIRGLRNGFWAVWSIPILLALPQDVAISIQMTRTGAMSLLQWVISLGYIALSVAAVVTVASRWQSVWQESGEGADAGATSEPREILVWPPVLAAMLPGLILIPVAFVATDAISAIQPYLQSGIIVVTALLIPLFVFGYVRLASANDDTRSRLVVVGGIIAVVQIAIIVAGRFLNTMILLPIRLDGLTVIVLTVVVLGLVAKPASTRTP